MAVVIDSGPVSATQRLVDVPMDRWRELVSARRSFCAVHLPHDCRELLHFVDDAPDILTRGLELDPAMVEWAVQGLQRLKPDEPIPLKSAIAFGQNGGDRRSEEAKNQPSIIRLKNYGTTKAYYLARLERDYKPLAAKVRSGELKAYAAAKVAGIVKPPTCLKQLQRLWRKTPAAEREAFLRWTDEATP
jgi:hypothetical protein